MGKCLVCGNHGSAISDGLGVCPKCIREKHVKALGVAGRTHARSRVAFGLPAEPPKDADGLPCGVCANNCVIGVGHTGFCGLVRNAGGRLVRFGGTADKGVLEWYYDDLPSTSRKQALECQKAAERYLKNVRVGNVHLLS